MRNRPGNEVFTGLRLGLTYILISIISMEYIVQVGGLGRVVADTYLRFRMEELYSSIGFVVILSAAFIYLTYRGEQMVRR
jgi:NitT/TauT family transport system permease protein